LRVKAVYFRQGAEEIAIVECDQTNVSQQICREVRRKAKAETGILFANICVAATHTHMASPSKPIVPAALQAIVRAKESAKQAELIAGIGTDFQSAHNRRYWMKDGSVMFNPMFLNPNIVCAAGPIDPYVPFVLAKDASTGKPFASITNYALHCDTVKEYGARYQKEGVGSENTVSADYPYWLEKSLQKEFGNDFFNLFVNGCCGNINHINVKSGEPQKGHAEAARIGTVLAGEVIKTYTRLKPLDVDVIRARSEIVPLPLAEYSEDELEHAREISQKFGERNAAPFMEMVNAFKIIDVHERKGKPIDAEVQVFTLGNDFAFVSLPGEVFVELGIYIKERSPYPSTMVLELTNGSVDYIPDRKAFAEGNYEAVSARCAPGSGEFLVERVLEILNEMKNMQP